MPYTEVFFYQEKPGESPIIEWLDKQPEIVRDKKVAEIIERLIVFGYELRRPHCDILEDGIYELRFRHKNTRYRLLSA